MTLPFGQTIWTAPPSALGWWPLLDATVTVPAMAATALMPAPTLVDTITLIVPPMQAVATMPAPSLNQASQPPLRINVTINRASTI